VDGAASWHRSTASARFRLYHVGRTNDCNRTPEMRSNWLASGRWCRDTCVMRTPGRRRPLRRTVCALPDGVDLPSLAATVRYVGSGEHKSFPSFAGRPQLRADASKCDPKLANPEELTGWLRQAIVAGTVGAPWEGAYPRYVWHRQGDVVYEGRLVNQEQGHYKGYPLKADELPEGLV